MTLSTGWQAFHTTFFVVILTTTTLVCVRNIVMNGNFRFASQPPVRLYELMTECETRTLWTVLAVTQTPAFFTLWYVARTTIREEVGFPGSDAGTWAVCGMALEPVGLVRRRPGGGVRVLVLPLRGMIDIK